MKLAEAYNRKSEFSAAADQYREILCRRPGHVSTEAALAETLGDLLHDRGDQVAACEQYRGALSKASGGDAGRSLKRKLKARCR